MSGALMDKAIADLAGKQMLLRLLEKPDHSPIDCETPLAMDKFIAEACRECVKVQPFRLVFDVHLSMEACGDPAETSKKLSESDVEGLPAAIKFKAPLPEGSKVDFIHVSKDDGKVDVLKVIYTSRPISSQLASSFCSGKMHLPVHRAGPWKVKKATQWLLGQLGGYQLRWHVLEEKTADSAPPKPSWSPSNAELEEGVLFINAHAPECDAQNEQTLWILINIKSDSGTPIASWPEPKVRLMCQNKSRGQAGAVSMTEFPLTTYSLKPFLHSALLPLLYPLMLNFGVLLLGCPGVGKTPFAVILAMALGRYHVRLSGDTNLKPGWRRAKSLDNFRHRAPRVQEALFLDDPCRAKVSMADLKSFLTVDEDGTVESRYNDTRLIRNQLRAYASNDLKDDLEEEQKIGTTLPPGRFLVMLDDLFAGEKEKDVLAVLKRSIIFVFTGMALYLRLPSENKEAIIHRICVDDLHKDLLADKDKPFYGKYKAGSMETGPSFDTDVGREQRMLEQAMNTMAEYEEVQGYIEFVNGKIQDALFRSQDIRILPGSPSSDDDDQVPLAARPVPPIGTHCSGRRVGPFVYPGRRVRRKATPVSQELEELAQAAEAQTAVLEDGTNDEMDFEAALLDTAADEEAAHALGTLDA